MSRSLPSLLLACSLLLAASSAIAEIKVIELQQRNADEMIEILAPFLSPDGALSGSAHQLIIRSDAQNIEQLEQIIQRLDKAPAQLLISVRQGGDLQQNRRGGSLSGGYQDEHTRIEAGDAGKERSALTLESGDAHYRVQGRLYRSDRANRDAVSQQLRTVEGQWAYIQAGQSVPFVNQTITQGPQGPIAQQGVEYKDVSSGFEVRARTNGENVIIEIRPYKASLSRRGGGAIDTQQVSTTVNGTLGQWIEIAGVAETEQTGSRGTVYSTRRKRQATQRVYLKVERVP